MTSATHSTVSEAVSRPLSTSELDVLLACQEGTLRHGEILRLLADALKVPEEQVYYTWAFRKCKQRGNLAGTDWIYYFHGRECDVKNTRDGRFLRFDFGPRGRIDTFTMWGVLQFIMASGAPWSEYQELKRQLAKNDPPYDEYSGSPEKMSLVWDSLEARGVFHKADAELVAFQAKHTSIGPDGLRRIRFPPGTSEELDADCSVAHRPILSPLGHSILEEHLAGKAS